MGKLKICAISDFHGILPRNIPKCDLLLIAGDISPFEIQGNKNEMNKWILETFSYWVGTLPCEHVVIVPGNHDYVWTGITKTKIDKLLIKINNIVTLLRNEYVELLIKGERVKIFGSPYCSRFGNWPFMRDDSVLNDKFSKIPEDLDILLTHDAPWGVSDKILEKSDYDFGKNCGSLPLRVAIERSNPKYCIHGHIHSASHAFETLNNTKVINVSLMGETCVWLEYEPFMFEL